MHIDPSRLSLAYRPPLDTPSGAAADVAARMRASQGWSRPLCCKEALRAGGLANRHHLRRRILLGNEGCRTILASVPSFSNTDVAGPGSAGQRQRAGRETPHILAEAAREFQQKMLGQSSMSDIRLRNGNTSEDVEPIEILGRCAGARLPRVLVRHGDDAHRHVRLDLPPMRVTSPFWEQAQERNLRPSRRARRGKWSRRPWLNFPGPGPARGEFPRPHSRKARSPRDSAATSTVHRHKGRDAEGSRYGSTAKSSLPPCRFRRG